MQGRDSDVVLQAWQAHLKYETLPEVTIAAGRAPSLIEVPKQRVYTGRMPLNATLGTSYTMDAALSSLLETFISNNDDFGTTYGLVRPLWSAFIDDRICNPQMPPRRLWDLYSNRVVPQWIAPEFRWRAPWAISHAWMNINDRIDVLTPINGNEWPVPIPKDADLDLVRIEMLNLGAEYVWLDVLCLRQRGGRGEDIRGEEWKLDVPTIGRVYRIAEKVVCYFSGLGRPLSFTASDFESDRCWFRRAWTLQEISSQWIIGGDMGDEKHLDEDVRVILQEQLTSLENIMPITGTQCTDNVFAVVAHMQKRVSENPACLLESTGYRHTMKCSLSRTLGQRYFEGSCSSGILNQGRDIENGDHHGKQIMTEVLPIHESPLREDVHQDEETDNDWYEGVNIEKGYVRGLAMGTMERRVRRGELVVQDNSGTNHTFNIIATHQYPIPEDFYTLISGYWELGYWVVGRRVPDQRFQKVSTFRMSEEIEGLQKLAKLGVGKWSKNRLI
ncbi:uncharacterized protein EV420DRAFT_1565510 [Desarmillaria tabescens]|uniref:Heterokaryon incompatibility domain-containing protein n=1 Tax=Armillaria tabescens TaxID=1929756 RepID=A0AA39JWE0_ARMTA|nr:uncharacterized protein EV420DRAFT_1565510 [Desarmillaria tabescens]KAK0449021.1 hypothetical protein EV420DRAFT_1565510 [Desarmillaria tabescens]